MTLLRAFAFSEERTCLRSTSDQPNPEAQEQESQILAVCVQHWLGEEGSIGPGQESDVVPYCGQGQLRLPVSHAIMYVNHNSLFTLSTLLIN